MAGVLSTGQILDGRYEVLASIALRDGNDPGPGLVLNPEVLARPLTGG